MLRDVFMGALSACVALSLFGCSSSAATQTVEPDNTLNSPEIITDPTASSTPTDESSPTDDDEAAELNTEVYSGEYGSLVLVGVGSDGAQFSYTNTTETDYSLFSDYLEINGVEFQDGWFDTDDDGVEDSCYGGVWEDVAAGRTASFTFLAAPESLDVASVTGQFKVVDFLSGEVLGFISFDYGDA